MFKDITESEAFKLGVELFRMVSPIARSFRGPDAEKAAAQLLQAAESVPANIAEGYGKGYCPDFVRYLRIALSSAGEVHGRLISSLVGQRSTLIEETQLAIRQVRRTRSLIQGLIRYVEREIERRKRKPA